MRQHNFIRPCTLTQQRQSQHHASPHGHPQLLARCSLSLFLTHPRQSGRPTASPNMLIEIHFSHFSLTGTPIFLRGFWAGNAPPLYSGGGGTKRCSAGSQQRRATHVSLRPFPRRIGFVGGSRMKKVEDPFQFQKVRKKAPPRSASADRGLAGPAQPVSPSCFRCRAKLRRRPLGRRIPPSLSP